MGLYEQYEEEKKKKEQPKSLYEAYQVDRAKANVVAAEEQKKPVGERIREGVGSFVSGAKQKLGGLFGKKEEQKPQVDISGIDTSNLDLSGVKTGDENVIGASGVRQDQEVLQVKSENLMDEFWTTPLMRNFLKIQEMNPQIQMAKAIVTPENSFLAKKVKTVKGEKSVGEIIKETAVETPKLIVRQHKMVGDFVDRLITGKEDTTTPIGGTIEFTGQAVAGITAPIAQALEAFGDKDEPIPSKVVKMLGAGAYFTSVGITQGSGVISTGGKIISNVKEGKPVGEDLGEAYAEGTKFGAQLASVDKIVGAVLAPVAGKIGVLGNPQIAKLFDAARTASGAERTAIVKQISKEVIKLVGYSSVRGGLGMGGYGATLPAKDVEERLNNAIELGIEGAKYSAILTGADVAIFQGSRIAFGKARKASYEITPDEARQAAKNSPDSVAGQQLNNVADIADAQGATAIKVDVSSYKPKEGAAAKVAGKVAPEAVSAQWQVNYEILKPKGEIGAPKVPPANPNAPPEITFNGADLTRHVQETNLAGTPLGDELVAKAGEAEAAGKAIQIYPTTGIGKGTFQNPSPTGGFLAYKLIDKMAPVEGAAPAGEVAPTGQVPEIKYVDPKVYAPTVNAEPAGKMALTEMKITDDVAPIDRVQVEAVKSSILTGDKINPIVVDEAGGIADGRHRYIALQELGATEAEVVRQVPKAPAKKVSEIESLKAEADTLLDKAEMTPAELERYGNIGDFIQAQESVDFFTDQITKAKAEGKTKYVTETQPILDRKIKQVEELKAKLGTSVQKVAPKAPVKTQQGEPIKAGLLDELRSSQLERGKPKGRDYGIEVAKVGEIVRNTADNQTYKVLRFFNNKVGREQRLVAELENTKTGEKSIEATAYSGIGRAIFEPAKSQAEESLTRIVGKDTKFKVVEPVHDLWKSQGNVLHVQFERPRSGMTDWLKQQDGIANAQEAGGNNVIKITLEKEPSVPKVKETSREVVSKPTKYKPQPAEKVLKAVTPKRASLPVLEGLQVKDGKAVSTDLTVFVETPISKKDGFYQFVGNDLVLKPDMPVDEFVQVPETANKAGVILGEQLNQIITDLAPSASRDETRPVLEAVNLTFNKTSIEAVSTDGFRLFRKKYGFKNLLKESGTTFNLGSPEQLKRAFPILQDKQIDIAFSDGFMSFGDGSSKVSVALVQGDFPPYQKVIDGLKIKNSITFSAKEMKAAIKELTAYAKQAQNVLEFTVGENSVKIKAGTKDLNKTVEVKISKKEFPEAVAFPDTLGLIMPVMNEAKTVALSYKYLDDIIKQVGTPDVEMGYPEMLGLKNKEYGGASNAITFTEPGQLKAITAAEIPEPKTKSKSPSGYASSGARKVGEFEDVEGTEVVNFKLHEKILELKAKYAKTVGEGYLPTNALGVYYPDTTNVRVSGMNDLSVAAHEFTHFLDLSPTIRLTDKLMEVAGTAANGNPIYDSKTRKYRKGLTDVFEKYYPGGSRDAKLRKRLTEGYATLLQKYVEMPNTISQEFPEMVSAFLQEGGEYYVPVVGDMVKDLKQIVSEYKGLDPLDKIGATVTSDGFPTDKKSFLSFGQTIRTEIADNIYPLEVLAMKSGTHFTIDDPSIWTRAYNNYNAVVLNNIAGKRGFWVFNGEGFSKAHDFNYKTLVDLLAKEKQTDSFAYYLVARDQFFVLKEIEDLRAAVVDLKAQVKEAGGVAEAKEMIDAATGKTLWQQYVEAVKQRDLKERVFNNQPWTEQEVTQAYEQNKARFTREEEMFDKMVRADLDFLHRAEVGLVDSLTYKTLTSREGYASLKREFFDEIVGDEMAASGSMRVGKTKVSSLLTRTGSKRTVINPLYSAMANHREVMRKGLKQIVYNKIGKIASSAAFPELFQKLQLKVVPDKQTGKLYFPQEKDPNIIMARLGGKRVPILTDAIVKRTVDEVLNYQVAGTFEQLVLGISRMFTKGTTGLYPGFALTNISQDQITAAINTRNKMIPVYDPLKKFASAISNKGGKRHEYLMEYLVMGGEKQTFVGWQDLSPNELFKAIRNEKNGLLKAVDAINKGVDVLALPSKWSEIITRSAEYIKSREAGKPQVVALEEAGRVTAAFHHIGRLGGGTVGKTYVKSIPFFNPAIQVLDQVMRTNQTPKGRARFAFVSFAVSAAMIGSLGVILTTATDEQKDLYIDLEASELAQFLYLPNPDGKSLIRVKLSREAGFFGVITNMAIMNMIANADYSIGDFLLAGNSILPEQLQFQKGLAVALDWTPQFIRPAIEVGLNTKTFPDVMPIVSQSLLRQRPEKQVKESTTALAKKLEEIFNLSPIKIDYLITGYFGRAAGFVAAKPGIYNPFSSVNREYYFSSGRRLQNFYDAKEKNTQDVNALKSDPTGFSTEERQKIQLNKNVIKRIDKYLDLYHEVDIEKNPEQAKTIRERILQEIEKLQ